MNLISGENNELFRFVVLSLRNCGGGCCISRQMMNLISILSLRRNCGGGCCIWRIISIRRTVSQFASVPFSFDCLANFLAQQTVNDQNEETLRSIHDDVYVHKSSFRVWKNFYNRIMAETLLQHLMRKTCITITRVKRTYGDDYFCGNIAFTFVYWKWKSSSQNIGRKVPLISVPHCSVIKPRVYATLSFNEKYIFPDFITRCS